MDCASELQNLVLKVPISNNNFKKHTVQAHNTHHSLKHFLPQRC